MKRWFFFGEGLYFMDTLLQRILFIVAINMRSNYNINKYCGIWNPFLLETIHMSSAINGIFDRDRHMNM